MSTASKASEKTPADTVADLTAKRAEDQDKAREKSAKAYTKASVQDRLLLALADALLKHPDFGVQGLSELHGELAEEVGVMTGSQKDQIIQHPDLKAAERQANIEMAVSSAKAAGLVAEDHKPAPDVPAMGEPHPTSQTPVTVSVPAGAPASEVKQDKPMDPTAKK